MKGHGLLTVHRTTDVALIAPDRLNVGEIKTGAPTPLTHRDVELVASYPAGYWAVQEADGSVSVYRMLAGAAAVKDGVLSVATEGNGHRNTALLARAMSAFKGKTTR